MSLSDLIFLKTVKVIVLFFKTIKTKDRWIHGLCEGPARLLLKPGQCIYIVHAL